MSNERFLKLFKEFSGRTVVQAGIDYLSDKKAAYEKYQSVDKAIEKEYERFFDSDECEELANINPTYFFEQLRKGFEMVRDEGRLSEIDEIKTTLGT